MEQARPDGPGQPLPPGIALAWGAVPGARRGPKPGHSVEEIVGAAVALADAGGIAEVSMPKVAARLGLTANALYRYIGSKDELLVLINDAGWGPAPEHNAAPTHWRAGAETWARAVLSGYLRRPWLLDIPVRGGPATPNLVGWLENLLRALAGTGLSQADTLGCAVLLDGFARSTALLARDLSTDATPAQAQALAGFLLPRLKDRGLPLLAEVITGGEYSGTAEETFDFGLPRILDGIEALVQPARSDSIAPAIQSASTGIDVNPA